MRLIEELRKKYPGMAKRAERSAFAAIRLFCLECMGGSVAETARCTTTLCSLHPFRMGHRPPGAEVEVEVELADEPLEAAEETAS